jgi:hypothetical protein
VKVTVHCTYMKNWKHWWLVGFFVFTTRSSSVMNRSLVNRVSYIVGSSYTEYLLQGHFNLYHSLLLLI